MIGALQWSQSSLKRYARVATARNLGQHSFMHQLFISFLIRGVYAFRVYTPG
jgi:hypothetical protein